MKRWHILSACVALCALAAGARGQVYVEGINDTLPPEPGWTATGGHEQAFRWTAQNTFLLTEIQGHSSPVNNFCIRLRADTGTTPGAILRESPLFSADFTGWHGAPFDETYPIVAGQTYFATFQSGTSSPAGDYHDFLGIGGVLLTYYWTPYGQELWNGPYTWAGNRMIKFFGFLEAPCPEDVNGDGVVDVLDLLAVIAAWGNPGGAEDVNGDGIVDVLDLLAVISAWGPC